MMDEAKRALIRIEQGLEQSRHEILGRYGAEIEWGASHDVASLVEQIGQERFNQLVEVLILHFYQLKLERQQREIVDGDGV